MSAAVRYAEPWLEERLCGWALGAPREKLAPLVGRLEPALLSEPACRAVLGVIRDAVLAGKPTDLVSVYGQLRASGTDVSAETIGRWYVEADEAATVGTEVLRVLEDVGRQRVARTVREMPTQPTGLATVTAMRHALEGVSRPQGDDPRGMGIVAAQALAEMDAPRAVRFETGIAPLDRAIGGFQPGDLVLVGARTSQGKSVLALRLARGICRQESRPVLYHSLEMPARALVKRCIADVASVENWRVQRHAYQHAAERERAAQGALEVGRLDGLAFWDTPGIWPEHLAAYERFAALHPDLAMLVVDYVGLIRSIPGAERRYQELGLVTQALKAFAQRHQCVVLAVSQLNRQAAGVGDRPPQLHELRESGDLEQDADTVLLLHLKGDPEAPEQTLEVVVAKHRSGALWTVPLAFDKRYCRIEDPALEVHWPPEPARDPGCEG